MICDPNINFEIGDGRCAAIPSGVMTQEGARNPRAVNGKSERYGECLASCRQVSISPSQRLISIAPSLKDIPGARGGRDSTLYRAAAAIASIRRERVERRLAREPASAPILTALRKVAHDARCNSIDPFHGRTIARSDVQCCDVGVQS